MSPVPWNFQHLIFPSLEGCPSRQGGYFRNSLRQQPPQVHTKIAADSKSIYPGSVAFFTINVSFFVFSE